MRLEEGRGPEEARGSRAALELGWVETAVLRSASVGYKLYPVLVFVVA